MKLSALVVMMTHAGCVCEPKTTSAVSTLKAGAALASGGSTIAAAAAAALLMQQQQQQQHQQQYQQQQQIHHGADQDIPDTFRSYSLSG
jgi:hypothetical protein